MDREFSEEEEEFDYGSSDFDDDYLGDEDQLDVEDSKSSLVPRELQYNAITLEQLQRSLESRTTEVCDVLRLSKEQALTLLQFYSWNFERLMEEYLTDPEGVVKKSGISPSDSKRGIQIYSEKSPFQCMICCEDRLKSFKLDCQHEYCIECYKHYIKDKVSSGSVIKCPSCDLALSNADLSLLVESDQIEQLLQNSTKLYIEKHVQFKWCPSADCKGLIEVLNPGVLDEMVSNREVPIAICNEEHQFCLNCHFEDHNPAPCDIAKKWVTKCRDDSETIRWITTNAQACPKCESLIEKNGGCNHMTCKKCTYEFCWICLGTWSDHGTAYYQCTRSSDKKFKEEVNMKDKNKRNAKNLLQKYLHYYNLFQIHEQSMNQDKKLCKVVEEKVRDLQIASGISWIEAQFLTESAKSLLKARRILKWSYSLSYFCDNSIAFMEIYNQIQTNLSKAVEDLSNLFEIEDPKRIVSKKVEFLNRCNFMLDRQKAMIETSLEAIRIGAISLSTDYL